ncbi:MAG: glycine cleavage system protein GcvH [Candidatus Omnitrophica bacterium]|jgi:glycine cleavage system H protein|nr:glycine cleavage system protein GcvH [Candidatus Omnitrophota bacterium]
MNIPKNFFYTKEHEWARIEGKTAYVGITDYAQASLGDITFVGLPKEKAAVKQSEYCATVESVKAASDVYAPFSGTVVSVNGALSSHPELVNQSPYEKGYFFVVSLENEAEKQNLMDAETYQRYVEGLA